MKTSQTIVKKIIGRVFSKDPHFQTDEDWHESRDFEITRENYRSTDLCIDENQHLVLTSYDEEGNSIEQREFYYESKDYEEEADKFVKKVFDKEEVMSDYGKLSDREKVWVDEINDLFYRNWGPDRKIDMGERFLECDLKAKREDFLDRIGLIVRAVRKIEWVLESLEFNKKEGK